MNEGITIGVDLAKTVFQVFKFVKECLKLPTCMQDFRKIAPVLMRVRSPSVRAS